MKKWVLAAVVLIAAALCARWVWVAAQRKAVADESARWRGIETALRQRVAALEKERDLARGGEPPPAAGHVPSASGRPPAPEDSKARLDLVHLLAERDGQLAAAEASAKGLEAKILELNGRMEQLRDQQARLQASENELREKLNAAAERAAAQAATLEAREVRLAEIEKANQVLRARGDESAKRLVRLRQLSEDLEDLARRRESYLTNILRRYRETTDLFRTLAVRVEPHEGAETPVSSTDLSRIQNVIGLADEDMRQLRGLNARALALAKDLREINARK